MNLPTRITSLFLALTGACAVEPEALDAPDPPVAEPALVQPPLPEGGRCRPAHPVPAVPVTPQAVALSPTQTLPPAAQITGQRPDLVSGNATRVEGEMWIAFGYRRTEAEVTTLRGRLVGADGETIELLPTDLASLHQPPEFGLGTVHILLPPSPARSLAEYVEVVLEDARGIRSATLPLRITDVARQPDGGPCLRQSSVFNICRVGSICSASGRCGPVTAPTLHSAEAFAASGPSGSSLALRWEDPNQDVVAIEVSARGRSEPLVIPVTASAPDGAWGQRWDRDVFEGFTWLNVRVRDQTGRLSNALAVAVSSPAIVAAGGTCDSGGIVSRCGAGMACSRDNGMSCSETRCVPDVAACPPGVSTTTLDTASSADGPWATSGSMAGVGEVRASACDRYVGRAIIHRFRAPSAGSYEFALAAQNDTWTTRIIARTRCAIGDLGAQEASTSRGSRRAAVTMALAAEQEVFLFATTEDRFTLSATRMRR